MLGAFLYADQNSKLEQCWKRGWWEYIKADVLPDATHWGLDNKQQAKKKIHDLRMLLRYDFSLGRKAFIEFFTHGQDYILSKI